ncbi:MAG: hypothetical protein IIA66_12140 [Planctomycetes bacterium]|nr:hypothetical protein [Planctomycetota bacterium]
MHRRSLTIVSLACLLLVLATWIASYFNFQRQGIKYQAVLGSGAFTLTHTEEWQFYTATGASKSEIEARRAFIDPSWTCAGYEGLTTQWRPQLSTELMSFLLVIPLWIPALAFAILPVFSVVRRRSDSLDYFLERKTVLKGSQARSLLTRLCVGGIVLAMIPWLVQLPGPLRFTQGPKFATFELDLHPDLGWTMVFDKPPHFVVQRAMTVQVPNEDAAALLPPSREYWLIGLGHGALQIVLADVSPLKPYGSDMSEKTLTLKHAVRVPLLYTSLALLAVIGLSNGYPWYLRRVRTRNGLCGDCGYNLFGLPSERCPECGAAIRPIPAQKPQVGAEREGGYD